MSGSDALLHVEGGSDQDEPPGQRSAQPREGGPAAFGLLYDLFEPRVFNFCHRLLGSTQEAADATHAAFLAVLTESHTCEGQDERFRLKLFAAARASCQEIMATAAEHAVAGLDEPDAASDEVFGDPDQALLLSSLQADVRAANLGLSPPEREVLALRELEYFSYAEIADLVGVDADAVAERMVSALLALHDELRPGSLPHLVATAPDCRRAMPLIASAQDAQLHDPEQHEWLDAHVSACQECQARCEAMEEAGISYRAWVRILPPPWLRDATAARVSERSGAGAPADERAATEGLDGDPDAEPGMGVTAETVAANPTRLDDDARRRFALGAASTLLLVLGVATALVLLSQGGGEQRSATSPPRTATAAPAPSTEAASSTPSRRRTPRRVRRTTTLPEGQSTSLRASPGAGTSRRRPTRRQVSRRPVRQPTEGGAFVPKRTAPAPPQVPSTPSNPTLSPRPSGGVPAPPPGGCPNASGAPGSC